MEQLNEAREQLTSLKDKIDNLNLKIFGRGPKIVKKDGNKYYYSRPIQVTLPLGVGEVRIESINNHTPYLIYNLGETTIKYLKKYNIISESVSNIDDSDPNNDWVYGMDSYDESWYVWFHAPMDLCDVIAEEIVAELNSMC